MRKNTDNPPENLEQLVKSDVSTSVPGAITEIKIHQKCINSSNFPTIMKSVTKWSFKKYGSDTTTKVLELFPKNFLVNSAQAKAIDRDMMVHSSNKIKECSVTS